MMQSKCAPLRRQLLLTRCCKPLASDHGLAADQLDEQLAELPEWNCQENHLERGFDFADFHDTIAFVNAIARLAHREDHHPEMTVSYKRCVIRWTTHSTAGISINDFICAAKTDAVYAGELN